ncbi:hypothetical protein CASFOL_018300 [Castilleja foliolosa]|uniref:Uncharacterized protein n=1 Tax=Castilleja foliolosa TaxID=1961234 RepID=A0ABD3D856_9LAMI
MQSTPTEMARKIVTARKSLPGPMQRRAANIALFKNSARIEHRKIKIGQHIDGMVQRWTRVKRHGVSEYVAVMKLIETLPLDWEYRARALFFDEANFTSKKDAPVISFADFAATLSRLWIEDVIENEGASSDESEGSSPSNPVEEDPEENPSDGANTGHP